MQVNDARMLRGAAIPTALAGLVAVIISSLAAGGKGAIGAAAATLVVLFFFGLGLYVLQRITRKHPELIMGVGMVTYVLQLLLLGVVLAVFKDTDLFDTRAFGLTVLGTSLVWIAAMGRGYLKAKILYVEPESSTPPLAGSADPSSESPSAKGADRGNKQTGAH
ncbi:hypothetical protein ACFQLX_20680 [Streptomyces polyrhachis]|uniref:ATP synthase protein I n=1 Tax=Streptomyces polyrhachis TaxID=1282885 RepID=A0ABW2GKR5_9ACTN